MTNAGSGSRRRTWLVLAASALALLALGALARDLAGRFDIKGLLASTISGGSKADAAPPVIEIRTAFHTMTGDRQTIAAFEAQGQGGAIEEIGDFVLVAGPEGQIGYLKPGEDPAFLPINIPLNIEALRSSAGSIGWDVMHDGGVRVLDLLSVPRADGARDLLVSHQTFRDNCIELRISAISLDVSESGIVLADEAWRTLFVATPCIDLTLSAPSPGVEGMCVCVGGGRMVLADDRTILFTTGDHEFDGRAGRPKLAQDPASTLGKIMKLDLSTGETEIFATGFRNGQGLLATKDGRIWETEHGPRGGDELNLIVPDANYGWPEVTLGTQYNWSEEAYRFLPWPGAVEEGRHQGYQKPVFAFLPSIAVSNLVEVDGAEFPSWQGDLIVGSLGGQKLVRLRREGDSILYAEPIDVGLRIRDVIILSDGALAIWSDSHELIIFRDHGSAGANSEVASQPALGAKEAAGRDIFNARCVMCHDLFGANASGPTLAGVLDREIGSASGYTFSPALSAKNGRWTPSLLAQFLRDPSATVAGTTMPATGLSAGDAEAVAAYLAAKS